ncbi:hypothetical protein CG419_03855 [Latilactobacillus curvatus]|uniref:Uncharacterized protein n=1 Tax=Latilactobacillus curvatus TaxID=28038 RepID=A0AAC9UQY2_LATCU|nr:hypothetical protein [Latilactobacillus curvatus]ASN59810.1 hypothetical protein CG419_03855 [Latilactobacillus curvatus]
MRIKLTLDEKYRALVESIVYLNQPCVETLIDNNNVLLGELAGEWFDARKSYKALVKVVERIHSADEIEWIESKYNWRLKSEKFESRNVGTTIGANAIMIAFYINPYDVDVMTESEFKKLLEGTGLPFEAFERVEIDD